MQDGNFTFAFTTITANSTPELFKCKTHSTESETPKVPNFQQPANNFQHGTLSVHLSLSLTQAPLIIHFAILKNTKHHCMQ